MTQRIVSFACLCISLVAVAVGLICLVNPHRPLFYLIDIFTLPALSLSVALTLVFFWAKQRPAAWTGVAAVAILMIALIPQVFTGQPPADKSRPSLRLVFANLYVLNPRPDRLVPWIEAQNPDIIATVENDDAAYQRLVPVLGTHYPYVAEDGQTVVYSRFPMTNLPVRHSVHAFACVQLTTPDGPVTLVVAHMGRPIPLYNNGQRHQIDDLLTYFAHLDHRQFILAGDFNSDLSGYALQNVGHTLSLHAASAPIGTWPAVAPGVFRIAIDNVFAGDALSLSQRRVGPNFGSDHRPVSVLISAAGKS